jgi:hypothetical protein
MESALNTIFLATNTPNHSNSSELSLGYQAFVKFGVLEFW